VIKKMDEEKFKKYMEIRDEETKTNLSLIQPFITRMREMCKTDRDLALQEIGSLCVGLLVAFTSNEDGTINVPLASELAHNMKQQIDRIKSKSIKGMGYIR